MGCHGCAGDGAIFNQRSCTTLGHRTSLLLTSCAGNDRRSDAKTAKESEMDSRHLGTIVFLFAACGTAHAEYGRGDLYDHEQPVEGDSISSFYHMVNPSSGQMIASLTNTAGDRVSFTLDRSTDAVYLADSQGRVSSLSIPQLASAYAPGDLILQNSFSAEIRSAVSGTYSHTLEVFGGASGFQFSPPNGIPSACDMSPCIYGPAYRTTTLDSFVRWSPENIDYSYTYWYTPEQIDEDRDDFARWQNQECDKASGEFAEFLLTGTGAVASCGTSEIGGLTAIACGSMVAATLKKIKDQSDASWNCRSAYPGPGKWAR
jgi:hypothetical protein